MMNIGDDGENPPASCVGLLWVLQCGMQQEGICLWEVDIWEPPPHTNTADKIGPFKRN